MARLILGLHGTYYGDPDGSVWGRDIAVGDAWTDVHGNPQHIITSIEDYGASHIFAPGEALSAHSGDDWGITIEANRLYGYRAVEPTQPSTVKRLDIFGQVHDTYATEAELNGWHEKQGALL